MKGDDVKAPWRGLSQEYSKTGPVVIGFPGNTIKSKKAAVLTSF
jgi:hypothetical protein